MTGAVLVSDSVSCWNRPPVAQSFAWIFTFADRPRLLANPISEIESIASLVDIVDLVEALMVFAGHFGAVPIRYATGLEIPRDPKDPTKPLLGPDGKPAMGFKPRADHFWGSTSKDAKFGQLSPAALDGFVSWAQHATARIRAKTTVPGSYYGNSAQTHMSAELLKTDEAPMVRRVLSMGRDGAMNQAWRRLGRMILAVESPGLVNARVTPRWNDPETRVEAQAMDAFQKAVASGLGVRAAAEKLLGWSPELVERAVKECIHEGILEQFLRENRAEVIAMSIFEYDQEEEERKLRKAEFEAGVASGIERGIERGIEQGKELEKESGIRNLIDFAQELGLSQEKLRLRLMECYKLSEEAADDYTRKYWEGSKD